MRTFLMLCLVALITGNSTAFAQKGYEKSIEAGASIRVGDYSNNTFGLKF